MMRIRSIARSAALTVPPLRRLFDYAMSQARENAERTAEVALLRGRLDQHQAEHQYQAEHQSVEAAEREALELQLYVMRSDYQRAVVRNEKLAMSLRECEARATQEGLDADRRMRDADRQIALLTEMLAAERRREIVGPADLELVYAKIAGRLTMLSSEVGQLRSTRPGSGDTNRYLDLLELALTGRLLGDTPVSPWSKGYDPEIRAIGRDWPSAAQTMIGAARLRNLRVLVERVLQEGIPGDMLEAGVWRGGACILMRGVLAAHGVTDRTIWVADSFAGLPPADPAYPSDTGDQHSTYDVLAVSLEEVRANFERYGLLDGQVRFLKGWFADTLPVAPVEKIAILRLDGDMYSSTIQTLDALYWKVSLGGFIIVDDYILPGCRQAILDFRARHGIDELMHDIDGAAVFWEKG